MLKNIKELGWLIIEEMLFGMGLSKTTYRRSRNEYQPRHTAGFGR